MDIRQELQALNFPYRPLKGGIANAANIQKMEVK